MPFMAESCSVIWLLLTLSSLRGDYSPHLPPARIPGRLSASGPKFVSVSRSCIPSPLLKSQVPEESLPGLISVSILSPPPEGQQCEGRSAGGPVPHPQTVHPLHAKGELSEMHFLHISGLLSVSSALLIRTDVPFPFFFKFI